MFLADLEWAVVPPFLLGQFRVFYKDGLPLAGACWANVSDEVLARLKKLGARIRPREWNSGEHVVLMAVVAPFGGAEKVAEEVRTKLFAGRQVHWILDLAAGAE